MVAKRACKEATGKRVHDMDSARRSEIPGQHCRMARWRLLAETVRRAHRHLSVADVVATSRIQRAP
eukprot:5005098-Alexandrium_andersonii.AAC.1